MSGTVDSLSSTIDHTPFFGQYTMFSAPKYTIYAAQINS